jgi:hypothetical protein
MENNQAEPACTSLEKLLVRVTFFGPTRLLVERSRPPGISGCRGRCAPSADQCPSPPTRTRTGGAPGCPGRDAAAARAGRHRPECAPFRPPAGTRSAADLDPDARVGLDVLDPVGAPPALGHQPEGLPSRPSHTGVRRGRPVRRPVVSSRASPGGGMPSSHASMTIGLTIRFCSGWTTRFLAADPAISGPVLPGRSVITDR